MKNLLKHKNILIIFIIFILTISILVTIIINNSKDYNETNELWSLYDFNINEINNNLQEITEKPSNDVLCGNLKDLSLDNNYNLALNSLACYINMYYYDLIEYNENYHNYLKEYRNKTKIKKKDIINLQSKLKNNDYFYNNLEALLTILDPNDNKASKFIDKINNFTEMFDSKFYSQDKLTYNKLFVHKMSEITYVTYLSSWLKTEYYKQIN